MFTNLSDALFMAASHTHTHERPAFKDGIGTLIKNYGNDIGKMGGDGMVLCIERTKLFQNSFGRFVRLEGKMKYES
jgi:hypothetical protein